MRESSFLRICPTTTRFAFRVTLGGLVTTLSTRTQSSMQEEEGRARALAANEEIARVLSRYKLFRRYGLQIARRVRV